MTLALFFACTQPAAERPREQVPPREIAPNVEAPPPIEELPRAATIHSYEIVTAGADADTPLPMIVGIHGLGDTPEHFADIVAGFDRPARVILPRGLDPTEEGWSWFPLRARDPDVESLARGISFAEQEIAAAVTVLVNERPTRGKPIVFGFSQGGMLSFALAVEHPELWSAAIPIGGWLPPSLVPADSIAAPPIVALHGDADVALPIQPTRDAVAALRDKGLAVELHEYPEVGHAIPPPMREELFALLRAHVP